MKIGIVLSSTPTYSETFFRYKIKNLMDEGHEVILFSQYISVDFKDCRVIKLPIYSQRAFIRNLLICLASILKLIPNIRKLYRFYILESKNNVSNKTLIKKILLNVPFFNFNLDWLHFGFATMALNRENLAKAIGAKMAVSFRGYDIAIYPLKYPNCYDLLWSTLDKVHTISDDLLNLAYSQGLPKTIPALKITPAIDILLFDGFDRNHFTFNKTLKILTVSRLHWKKGLTDTIEALLMLKKTGIDFQYFIVGEGNEKEALIYAVHQLKLGDNVKFLGKKSQNEIVSLMKQSDIYLQYSISEGFCNAVLEAQSMGLLCLVSDAEGLNENVVNGITGWIVPKRRPNLLYLKLKEVNRMTLQEKRTISNNASSRVREYFTIEKQRTLFNSFYLN